jgi:putative holliday junction resolvase
LAKYLGIDYGARRIGLAIGDDDTKLAIPKTAVSSAELEKFIKDEGPFDEIIVGLPRNLNGNDTSQTIAVRRFSDDFLWRKLHVEPIFQDEAATSQVAEERLKQVGKPYEKGDIDAEAAAIILQDYLDTL